MAKNKKKVKIYSDLAKEGLNETDLWKEAGLSFEDQQKGKSMRELTKQQKIKVLDEMILKLKERFEVALCEAYDESLESLKYKIYYDAPYWTPRFKELNDAIESELKRTSNGCFIDYDNWTDDRIDLLKKVKKQLC